MRKYHLMKHPDKVEEEGFVKVALNQWARKRKEGYEFVTAEEEAEARVKAVEEASEEKASKKKASKKKAD